MKREKKAVGEIAANLSFGLNISFCAAKKHFIMKCILLFVGIALPLSDIWIWKEILNRISKEAGLDEGVFLLAGLYLLQRVVAQLAGKVNEYVDSRFAEELHYYMDSTMMEKISRMDLEFFDSAAMGDKIHFVRENQEIIFTLPAQLFEILSNVINAAVALILVSAYQWWLGLAAVLLLLPGMICSRRHHERLLDIEKKHLRHRRKMEYYNQAFYQSDGDFELKFNKLGDYFLNCWREIWARLYRIDRKEERSYSIWNGITTCLSVSGSMLTILISVEGVLHGRIGIGNLQYNLSMVSRLREQVCRLVENINRLLEDNARISGVREFVEMDHFAERTGTKLPSANPEITFCNVSFRYPNTEEYVLKKCSFTIRPYEKVGLIGLNGAGKSTIIKLMFRFYDPEEGCILLDGTDLREYDVYAVRRVFGVLFQDYVTYSLPVREVIALSDFKERHDRERLGYACSKSGADKVIAGWPDGYDSILGRFYADGGKSLSGGQWQLMGLARAYFRKCEFMILDEPSAALDPISEDRLFKQMYCLGEGKSTLTISHRLSNTILADKILVIENGGIIESGTHKELVALNGIYAHLFQLQAGRYL